MKEPNSECLWCGAAFWVRPSQKNHGRGRYCSNSCKSKFGRSLQDVSGKNSPAWKGGVWKKNMKKKAAQWNKENPAKRKVHSIVSTAIKSGKLKKQPCEACSATSNIDAHHDDYSKPLDVRWLCRRCHLKHHRARPAL